jgi:hypothetical protein
MRKRHIEDSFSKTALSWVACQLLLRYVEINTLTDPRAQMSSYSRKKIGKRSSREGRMMTKSPKFCERYLRLSEVTSIGLGKMRLLFEIFNLNRLFEIHMTLRMLCVC